MYETEYFGKPAKQIKSPGTFLHASRLIGSFVLDH